MNVSEAPGHPTDWYLEHVLADTDRMAAAVTAGPADAAVAACPGWTVLDVARHTGSVHRWATFCVEHARPPTEDDAPMEPFDGDDPAGWLRRGAETLTAALRAVDADAPTWHPFPVEHVASVWPRRQAHETAIHRWDVERAVGTAEPLEPTLASDGIDEYLEIVVPRLMAREGIELPAGSLHIHCTDVAGEWLVWAEEAELRVVRAHEKGDAALRGAAPDLVLRMWGRVGDEGLDRIGDETVLDGWLDIAGM